MWHWKIALAAGASANLGYVAGDETNDKAAATREKVARWAGTSTEK